MLKTLIPILALISSISTQSIGVYFGPDIFTIGMMQKDSLIPELLSPEATSLFFSDDIILFGYESLKQKDKSPTQVINLSHLYPGRTPQDPKVQQFIKDNFILYDIHSHPNTSSISFNAKYLNQSEVMFSIEEMYAMLFNFIKENGEFNYRTTITSALVTVPTFYSYKEKEALRQGIELSNLALSGFITENIAIAVDYQFNTTFSSEGQMTMILHIGSRYAQSSIYEFSTDGEGINEIKTMSEAWDRDLGERELDRIISLFLFNKYKGDSNKDITLDSNVYYRFFYRVWKCKDLFKDKEEVTLTIEKLEDKPVVMKVTRSDLEPIVNELVESIMKLVNKTVLNSKLDAKNIKNIHYIGKVFKYPLIREKIDAKIKEILSKEIVISSGKSKSIVRGVSLLSGGNQMIRFINGGNSQIDFHFTNKFLQNTTSKICNDTPIENEAPLYNSSCIHDLDTKTTFISTRQGYEFQRSISLYHDTDFEIVITEKMEGDQDTEASVIKTYRIADIPLLLEEMESYSVKTLPQISLLFNYNRVGQIALKAEGSYNITLYLGKSLGPQGSEEVVYSQEYSAPLSEAEIKEIDRKINASVSEDEKMLLRFKRNIGMTKNELIDFPLSIIATYPNPQPMLKGHFSQSKEKLGRLYQSIKKRNAELVNELKAYLSQISHLISDSNEEAKFMEESDKKYFRTFVTNVNNWYEENNGAKAPMNIVYSKHSGAKFAIKFIHSKIEKGKKDAEKQKEKDKEKEKENKKDQKPNDNINQDL